MNKIKILDSDEICGLSGLIDNYPYKPCSWYPDLDNEIVSRCLYREIQNTAETKENYILGLVENDTIVAFCVLKKSAAESHLLKKRIFSLSYLVSGGSYPIQLKNKLQLLRYLESDLSDHIDMLSCRAQSDDLSTIHALENQTFLCMDILGTYSVENPYRAGQISNSFCTVRLSHQGDLQQLKEIAGKSFSYDRFHHDPVISSRQSDKIYEMFIENAVRRIGADKIMVAEHNGEIIGFNTIELKKPFIDQSGIHIGSFILNAISPRFRNKGVFSHLIHDSIHYLEDSVDFIETRVHLNNYPAIRGLSAQGFRLRTSHLTFHRWNSGKIRGPKKRSERE